MILRHIINFSIILGLISCTAHKNIPYLQDVENGSFNSENNNKTQITVNDQLTITVNSTTPEAALAFNLTTSPTQITGQTVNMGQNLQTYQVSSKGTINFPVIGEIKVVGLTKEALEDSIKTKIFPRYLNEAPIVIIRITNFRVSVLGEVNKPGSYTISNEKVNILEALALAGDLSLYGKRNNVLLIRTNDNGSSETNRINLQDKKLLESPYFYLKQNDIIYVQPNKTRGNASAIGSVETLGVSVTSVMISLTSLMVTIFK